MTVTKPSATFKVDFSENKDDPLDFAFRHRRTAFVFKGNPIKDWIQLVLLVVGVTV